jgi:prepilin-type N-terminal cleavage/methylation domain-containing protein
MVPCLPKRGSRDGFTLIELVVVISIIAILSSLMVVEMRGTLQDSLVRAASRELISACQLASSRAIAVNRLYRIQFNRSHYLIEEHVRGDEFVPARGVPEAEGSIDSRIVLRLQETGSEDESAPEEQVETVGNGNAVNFYPDGTADSREIDLRDQDGFGLGLRISSVTARVQIIELPRL